MADYEGSKVDGVGRTLGGVALGGAGISLIGSWLGSALQNVATYIGAAVRGGGPVPFGGFGGHPGFAAPAGFAGGFGGLEHENVGLRIENANLRTNTRVEALEKELAFEKERRIREDMSVIDYMKSHYVPGTLVMPATSVVTTTPVGGSSTGDTSTAM